MKQEQRLLRRWTFNLANELIDEGWDRKYAFKQAHLCRRLLQCLGVGKVVFEYYKKDGTVRRAHGTLCKGISKDFDHYIFTYYDLDATGFRTFHATKLVRIIETVIKTNTL